ncbi:MAG: ketoacyl-ACP synthase III, partial [Terracidiphilus sp.]
MSFLNAFGSHLPDRRVSNAEISALVGTTPEWILDVSGIEERRYAADSDTVASLGLLAAQNCLANAGKTAADLGMILVASGSAPRFSPGPASQIANGLGLAATPAYDIPVASCGSLIGLALAA